MSAAKIVIAGGGMVAGYAAKQMVELGLGPGELIIISADSVVPYERPPLSKTFLSGKDSEESIRINPEPFYKEHGIDLRLNTRITAVDTKRKTLSLSDGSLIEFQSLLLATGSVARPLTIPGANLAGVYYLRSMSDSRTLRDRAKSAKHAVVIGGGFIGMEVASVLAGKNVDTTMVMPDNRVWQHFFTAEMSAAFERYFEKHGVHFVKGATVKELKGAGGVEGVVLADGRTLPCDTVVAGIGAVPVTDYLAGSGIEVSNGVVVNERLETSVPGIFAAGDIANYPDVLFGKRRRVEHWDNAVQQGQHCARAIMGQGSSFRHVPYFFSDVFDLSYEYWGDSAGSDEVVHRGDLSGTSFSVWWLRQGVLVAAFVMSRPDDERDAAPRWIEARQSVAADRLAVASSPIAEAKTS